MVGWDFLFIFSAAMLALLSSDFALAAKRVTGLKYPNSVEEGLAPIRTSAWAPDEFELMKAKSSMLPYVQPSPDQDEAGSCLYMSLTGVAEWWLNKLNPLPGGVQVQSENDLSERHLMNVTLDSNLNRNWKTDTLLGLNTRGKLLRNRAYRFAKGWYRENAAGRLVLATPNSADASYGTMVNWINQVSSAPNDQAELPRFERTVIAKDPAGNQWNTAVMPNDIVERVKTALDTNGAPVQVIYNHVGYWHSVIIVGYDDSQSTEGCEMVEDFVNGGFPNSAKVKRLYNAEGGCAPEGVFLVRDSLYIDESAPTYIYDPSNDEANTPYTKKIIYREYQWLKWLANHVVEWRVVEEARR